MSGKVGNTSGTNSNDHGDDVGIALDSHTLHYVRVLETSPEYICYLFLPTGMDNTRGTETNVVLLTALVKQCRIARGFISLFDLLARAVRGSQQFV